MTGSRRPGSEPWPTGSTFGAGVIGSPVRHSLSPVLHNAAFAATGLDWAYLAFEVAPGDAAAAVLGARVLGLRGLSVTMPHKQAVIPAVDRLTPTAQALQAVNTIVFGKEIVGDSTDGVGFVAGLRGAVTVAGCRCVVAGAGGAARAVVLALAEAGAAEVTVLNRTPERAVEAAALAGDAGRAITDQAAGRPAVRDAVRGADLVVNATPVGMAGAGREGSTPFDPDLLRDGQVLVDLVYEPRRTALMLEAERRGLTVIGGLPMLVHQAAAQFTLWTGDAAPLEAMEGALTGVAGGPVL